MNFKYIIFFILTCLITSTAFSEPFEEKNPRDEMSILVPKGARPVLKEEYPRGQLVVERIKARHRYNLSIPFARAWNTAALTFMSGINENPDIWDNREASFAIHNQRLRIGAVKNKEYFQKETAGFPEGRYWAMPLLENVNRTTGYMSSTFIHLMFKQIRNSYTEKLNDDSMEFKTSDDRLNGLINVMIGQNQNLSLEAQRNSQNLIIDDKTDQTRIRNSASISYRRPGQGSDVLILKAMSVWSGLTDESQRKFDYVTGIFLAELGKRVLPSLDVNAKAKLQLSNLVDQTTRSDKKTLESRKIIKADVSNTAIPVSFIKLKLNATGIYDSEFDPYMVPDVGLIIGPKAFQIGAGYRRKVILPDFDELYWRSKSVIVNDSLKSEDFWEAYGLLNVDVTTRLKLMAQASYGQPQSRITWIQLNKHVWYPTNIETSESINGEASLELNVFSSFNVFANYKFERYDTSLFEPEHLANVGFSYGRPLSGTLTFGGCYWKYQPAQAENIKIIPTTESSEDIAFVYMRMSKPFFNRFISLYIDGRYSFGVDTKNGLKILDRRDVIYYLGIPQSGQIITVGANIIFGGLD